MIVHFDKNDRLVWLKPWSPPALGSRFQFRCSVRYVVWINSSRMNVQLWFWKALQTRCVRFPQGFSDITKVPSKMSSKDVSQAYKYLEPTSASGWIFLNEVVLIYSVYYSRSSSDQPNDFVIWPRVLYSVTSNWILLYATLWRIFDYTRPLMEPSKLNHSTWLFDVRWQKNTANNSILIVLQISKDHMRPWN